MLFPILTTPRLQLRELTLADAPALLALYADREHMRWYGIEPLADLAAAEMRIKSLTERSRAPNSTIPWAIDCAGGFIGTCGLFGWHPHWRKCSIGYELTRAVQGHGFMTEALRAIITWGFIESRLNRLEAQVHPNNARSIQLLRRLGFVREGLMRQAAYWSDEFQDMLQFSLLRSEWSG